jgi:hypothetical protein
MTFVLQLLHQLVFTSACTSSIPNSRATCSAAPLAFVKQTNIAHNQQVNNAIEQPAPPRKTENQQNELLTEKHVETLDTLRASVAGD